MDGDRAEAGVDRRFEPSMLSSAIAALQPPPPTMFARSLHRHSGGTRVGNETVVRLYIGPSKRTYSRSGTP